MLQYIVVHNIQDVAVYTGTQYTCTRCCSIYRYTIYNMLQYITVHNIQDVAVYTGTQYTRCCSIYRYTIYKMLQYITDLVCYTYIHWFFNPECQHIFGKQTGYIFQSPKTIKKWTTQHYASLNQWYNTE